MKSNNNIKKTKKLVKDYMGAGMMLGVGSVALGAMGQGEIAGKIATPASNMLGVGITAGMGMGIMNYVNQQTKANKQKKFKFRKTLEYR